MSYMNGRAWVHPITYTYRIRHLQNTWFILRERHRGPHFLGASSWCRTRQAWVFFLEGTPYRDHELAVRDLEAAQTWDALGAEVI
jgi:hypothetical protein